MIKRNTLCIHCGHTPAKHIALHEPRTCMGSKSVLGIKRTCRCPGFKSKVATVELEARKPYRNNKLTLSKGGYFGFDLTASKGHIGMCDVHLGGESNLECDLSEQEIEELYAALRGNAFNIDEERRYSEAIEHETDGEFS